MSADISIIIPTLKRKEYVIRLLRSLKNNIDTSCEIIIVEQVENNKIAFEREVKKLQIPFHYYFLDKASTPRAKNLGTKKSKGKYVIFFDDDIILKSKVTYFPQLLANKNIAVVNGRVLDKDNAINESSKHVGEITFWGRFISNYSSLVKQEIQTVVGCNVCWRKKTFLELGGFDEVFTGNALREEADLSLRAREKGYEIWFDPSVTVFHDRAKSGGTRKTEGRMQWYFDFFSNETYFFLKHWPFWSVPFILLTRAEWALRCMLGFGREVSIRSVITPFAGFADGYAKYWRLVRGGSPHLNPLPKWERKIKEKYFR